jgi:hypothetical protein
MAQWTADVNRGPRTYLATGSGNKASHVIRRCCEIFERRGQAANEPR